MLRRPVRAHGRLRAVLEQRADPPPGATVACVTLLTLDMDAENAENEPVYVFLSPDLERTAQQKTTRGEVFCYMAVHPNSDRKKNTFLGVSNDPIADLYMHNHADAYEIPRRAREPLRSAQVAAATKTTHAAAPYWSLNSLVGPFLTHSGAHVAREAWGLRKRGDESKSRWARVIAKRYDKSYWGHDVAMLPSTVRETIRAHLGDDAARLFDGMSTQLEQINTVTWPEFASFDVSEQSRIQTLLGTAGHASISFVRSVY